MNNRIRTAAADAAGAPGNCPRWLHLWAIATVVATLGLLVLGQFVTSFRVGMSDPIWPTEPWYLFVVGWQEPNRGYLIEHSHRIAGYVVGGFVSILALGLWSTEPIPLIRRLGLLLIVVLLAGYGDLHRKLILLRDPAVSIHVPVAPLVEIGAGLLGLLGLAISGSRGVGLRLLGLGALLAVMIQGLLGGLRVRLDALYGPELAPIHGVFAQVVFCLLASLAALTGPPVTTELPDSLRRRLNRLSLGLVAVLFVQLIWGAMVRHAPNAINQRLHLMTAFLAMAVAVWLMRACLTSAARERVAFGCGVLGALIALQVMLGVEAWMGKFGEEARRGAPAASHLAEAAPVTMKQAALGTAHTLIGTGVLATAVILALRIRQRPSLAARGEESSNAIWERQFAPEPALKLTAPGTMP